MEHNKPEQYKKDPANKGSCSTGGAPKTSGSCGSDVKKPVTTGSCSTGDKGKSKGSCG